MIEYPVIDPVAVSLGPFNIHWYAVTYLVGFLICWRILLSLSDAQRQTWRKEQLWDLISYGVFGVILGGRMGYVLFYGFEQFLDNPLMILKIWQGGMSFHGGLLGVIAALALYAHRHQRRFIEVADFVAPGAPLALGLGRIGNFINAELPGRVTDVPWAIIYPGDVVGRHPSSLYQMTLEGPVLFLLVYAVAIRRPRVAATSGAFLLLYGSFRWLTEFFRAPDPHMGFMAFGWMTQGQILCLPMILLGLVLIAVPDLLGITTTAPDPDIKGRKKRKAS